MTEPNKMPDEIWVTPCPDDHTNTTAWLYQRLPSDVKYTRSHPPTVTAKLDAMEIFRQETGPENYLQHNAVTADEAREDLTYFLEQSGTLAHNPVWKNKFENILATLQSLTTLKSALQSIKEMTDPDNPESYRSDDREGCFDTVFSIACGALSPLIPEGE